jgi:hypothetical protein
LFFCRCREVREGRAEILGHLLQAPRGQGCDSSPLLVKWNTSSICYHGILRVYAATRVFGYWIRMYMRDVTCSLSVECASR